MMNCSSCSYAHDNVGQKNKTIYSVSLIHGDPSAILNRKLIQLPVRENGSVLRIKSQEFTQYIVTGLAPFIVVIHPTALAKPRKKRRVVYKCHW